MKIDNQSLKLFTGSMATCLASALPARKALELSAGRTESKALAEVVRVALDRCDQGLTISEALEPAARFFPRYFLPVLRAGEASGRQVEAFQLLYQHCLRIGPSLRVVRNTWLYPLVCIGFGWIIRTAILVYFGRYAAAWQFVEASFVPAALSALAGWWLFKLPAAKRMIDSVLLQIPLLRETEIRMTMVLFFSTFRLVYEAGGISVLHIFDLALATVRSDAIREDLLNAREILVQNGTFEDAFAEPALLDHEIKGMIHVGAISGQLDKCITTIVEKATWQLEQSLNMFNQIFQRLVVFSVAMSIVETLLVCLL